MPELDGPLVSAEWLALNLHLVQLVDSRWSIPTGPKRADYDEAHIPGAMFADLDVDLSAPAGPEGRHPLPTPEAFAALRSRLGLVGPVVVYDDDGGSMAARLWWMLDSIGVSAAVLDGGLNAWPGALTSEVAELASATIAAVPWPSKHFLDADALLPAIERGAIALDARSVERFRGDPNPIDKRAGHVPGATSWPWQQNLDPSGHFRRAEELAAAFEAAGVDPASELITSCGSGVTGCHVLLAARVAGLTGGRLYAGSWSEWSADSSRPIATGE